MAKTNLNKNKLPQNARHGKPWVHAVVFIGLAAVTIAAYEPIRHNDFVNYDDGRYIYENTQVTSGITLQSIGDAFTKSHFYMWHPMTTINHMLDYQLFGPNPFWHHIISVFFHIVSAMLLFWILTDITGTTWPCAFAAAVFALHPLQAESVAWAAERKTVLSGLFWLLTIAAFVRYTRQPKLSRYILVLLVFGICIMTKPVVVTLPFVLLLLDWWPLDRVRWGHQTVYTPNQKNAGWLITEKIPLLVMSAILSVMTFVSQRGGGGVATLEKVPLDYRIANAFLSYMTYIGKMIWPSRLAVLYPHPKVNFSDATVIICALLFVIITVVIIYMARQRRYVAVGWLWYVGTLIPVIGLVQSGAQAMANRYMYVPMLGLLVIIGWAVKDFLVNRPRAKIITVVMGVIMLSSLFILTRMQVMHWQNSIALFDYTLSVTKDNALAENNYGSALLEADRGNEAIPHLKNAIRLNPTMAQARNNLGKIYAKQGKIDDAIVCFSDILRQGDDNAEAHYNLALAFIIQKKYDDAIKHLAKCLELAPKYPRARDKMGTLLLSTGRIDEAITCFNELLQDNDKSAEVHYNLALALGSQKKYDIAIKHLARVIELNPKYPGVQNRMGFALLLAGKPEKAIEHLNEALQTGDDKAEVYTNLGRAYQKMGKYEQAIQSWNRALELNPDNVSVLNSLAGQLATIGEVSSQDANRAVRLAQRACELTGYRDPGIMDTLAAAYAASGRFDDARAMAEKAVNAAKAAGLEGLVTEIESRLQLYREGQPYRGK